MSTETQRAEFCAFLRSIGWSDSPAMRENGKFINGSVQGKWVAWQAAQASRAAEIEALRRLLCAVYAGFSAYADDGEAQDNSAYPHIDFLRDTPEQIQAKMRERAFARAAAMQTKEAS